MNDDIKKLVNLATIVKVEDKKTEAIVVGDSDFRSRFQRNQGTPLDLETIEVHWDNKWKSFGNNWTKERQNYRFFFDSFMLFYYSFNQLRKNKVKCLEENDSKRIIDLYHFAGVNLYGVYHHGKKGIDILKELNLIDLDKNIFCGKFSETRNKLMKHNFNPSGMDCTPKTGQNHV